MTTAIATPAVTPTTTTRLVPEITPALLRQIRQVFAERGQEVSYEPKFETVMVYPKGSNSPIPGGFGEFWDIAQTLANQPEAVG